MRAKCVGENMGVYLNRSVIQIHLHFGFHNERFKQKASSDRNNIRQGHCT